MLCYLTVYVSGNPFHADAVSVTVINAIMYAVIFHPEIFRMAYVLCDKHYNISYSCRVAVDFIPIY